MSIAEPNTANEETRDNERLPECTHCDLPVPRGLIVADAFEQFCCSGCRVAYQLIHENGLDSYYNIVERVQHNPFANQLGNNDFIEFDQTSFLEKFAKPVAENEYEIVLLLDGIHCAACIWLIEKLPQIEYGVSSTKLNWAKQTARIRWRPESVPLSKIAKTLSQLGYRPHPLRASDNESRRQNENRKHLIRIGVAGAAAGNNMLIAIALYLGMFSQMGFGVTTMLRVASCIIGLAALLGPGRVFLRGALSAIRTRTPHMDLPIALGLAVGSVAGLVNTIRNAGEIYFDSLSVLIFFLLIGRWVQFRQQNRAVDAVEMLYRLTPKKARKIVDGLVVEVFVDAVEVGDRIEVRAGDIVPVDGEIVEGSAEIDESILTGESRAVEKVLGDIALAGTEVQNCSLILCATAAHNDTRLSKIVDLVGDASCQKPQIVQWANRVGGYFVFVVLLLASITLATWLWVDSSVAIDRTVALLIVACPCALALATPLAISVALGQAAKQKIMVKGGDVLQALNQPGMLWLDKTGTLTEGQLEVVQWYGDTLWMELIAKLEEKSSHPVAKAIVKYVQNETESLPIGAFDSVIEHVGQGMYASVYGDDLLVGNSTLMRNNSVQISRRQQRIADRILDSGYAPCWFALNGKVRAVLAIGERIRPSTNFALKNLIAAGWKIGILSGDHQRIVDRVAKRLGIEKHLAIGELSPEDKLKIVRESGGRVDPGNPGQRPTVVMVGDGVNDSAALAAATVGIAVHGGAESSLAAAPVYLAEEGLKPIVNLLAISRSTANTMRTNLGISLTYNIAGATLAFLGYINPLVAAILMPISSLTVVAMSLTAGQVGEASCQDSSNAKSQKGAAAESLSHTS